MNRIVLALTTLGISAGLAFGGSDFSLNSHTTATHGISTTTTAASTTTSAEPHVLLASPDHPRTWWSNQFDKYDQYLEWSDTDRTLTGKVVYAVPSYESSWNPVLYDSFKVTFPSVRFDAPTNRLYYTDSHRREVTVGHLESGVFGKRVELEKGIELDAHRVNGALNAAIVRH